MKYVFIFIIILLVGEAGICQPTDEQIKKFRIKEYKIIKRLPNKKNSGYSDEVIQYIQYNNSGNEIYRFSYKMDIVNTIDSTIYSYDAQQNLLEIKHYYIEKPKGKEQWKFIKSIHGTIDTIINLNKFYYDEKNRKIKEEVIKYGTLDFTKFLTYDEFNRLQKEQIVDEDNEINNSEKFFNYNSSGKMTKTTEYIFNSWINKTDTVTYLYKYDYRGNIIEEIKNETLKSSFTRYSYNENNKIFEKETFIESKLWGIKHYKNIYSYEANGYLIEEKEYHESKLYRWITYRYNEKGLMMEEQWMDVKKKQPIQKLVHEYKMQTF